LDILRIVVGVCLIAHFAKLEHTLPGVIGRDGLYWCASTHDAASNPWTRLNELDSVALRLVLGLGLSLAIGITLGVLPRLCAAGLFVIAVHIFRRSFPTTSLDDYLVCVALFWLCLLPIGRSLTWLRFDGFQRHACENAVEGWSSGLLLGQLLLIQLDVSFWRVSALGFHPSRGTAAAFGAIVAALIAPSVAIRASAAVSLLALHAWLAPKTGLVFTHGLFAASALLFWGERGRHDSQRPAHVGAAAALGGLVVLLSAMYLGASKFNMQPMAAESARLLQAIGLLPGTSGANLVGPAWVVEFVPDLPGAKTMRMRASDLAPGPRTEIVLRYLGSVAPHQQSLRTRVATTLVGRHCHASDAPSDFGKLVLVAAEIRQAVAWYDCRSRGDAPRVVMSDVLAGAAPREAHRSSSL
jgi:hypothetical protein